MSQHSQTVVVKHIGQSALGTAGLIFSCIGWLTCGLLCIPGAALSFLGLFSSKQKGHAIAGLIVGFPGVLFFFIAGAAILLPFIGLGAMKAREAAIQTQRTQQSQQAQQTPISSNDASLESNSPTVDAAEIESVIVAALPDNGEPPVPPRTETETVSPHNQARTFTDATGKFQIVAELIAVKNNWVKSKKADGKELSMPIAKLSQADQKWIAENTPK